RLADACGAARAAGADKLALDVKWLFEAATRGATGITAAGGLHINRPRHRAAGSLGPGLRGGDGHRQVRRDRSVLESGDRSLAARLDRNLLPSGALERRVVELCR